MTFFMKYKHKSTRKPPNSAKDSAKKLKIDLFGLHAVHEAWINPKRHIHGLYITEAALSQFDEALRMAQNRGIKRPSPTVIEKQLLDKSLPPGTVHQGIGLSSQALEEIDLDDIIRQEEPKDRSVLLMLDQVTDPHNVGAILRSACAFGAGGVIVQDKHSPELKGVLAKTACGAVEHCPVAFEINLARSIEALKKAGYFVAGLSEHADEGLSKLPEFPRLVLVLGAEGDGLRNLLQSKCDFLVRLPTQPPIASLNVSNAAAVALFSSLQP